MTELAVVPSLQPELTIQASAQNVLFDEIANDLADKGYSVHFNSLLCELCQPLAAHVQTMPDTLFKRAGIGREDEHRVNEFVRTDHIRWISADNGVQSAWLAWAEAFQQQLNQRLFLGLFSFESHFAHYAIGDFYKKHQDAFKGEANRIVSLVLYLNSEWLPDDGGELVLYTGEDQQHQVKVTPLLGTLVVFLSEQFPHEVLPALRDRYSIACWFRINNACIEGIPLTI